MLLVQDGDGVVCSWTDGHSNTFSLQWLYNRRFTDGGIKERRETLYLNKSVPWPAQKEMEVERLIYQQVPIDIDTHRAVYIYLGVIQFKWSTTASQLVHDIDNFLVLY